MCVRVWQSPASRMRWVYTRLLTVRRGAGGRCSLVHLPAWSLRGDWSCRLSCAVPVALARPAHPECSPPSPTVWYEVQWLVA
eukprot:4010334-Prymnesium_polylepis.1